MVYTWKDIKGVNLLFIAQGLGTPLPPFRLLVYNSRCFWHKLFSSNGKWEKSKLGFESHLLSFRISFELQLTIEIKEKIKNSFILTPEQSKALWNIGKIRSHTYLTLDTHE